MIKRYYTQEDKNQAFDDFNLSLMQVAAIKATEYNFWIVSDEEGKVTVSFESDS